MVNKSYIDSSVNKVEMEANITIYASTYNNSIVSRNRNMKENQDIKKIIQVTRNLKENQGIKIMISQLNKIIGK